MHALQSERWSTGDRPTAVSGRHDPPARASNRRRRCSVDWLARGPIPAVKRERDATLHMKLGSSRPRVRPCEAVARLIADDASRWCRQVPALVTLLAGVFTISCAAFHSGERREVQWPAALLVEWSSGNARHPRDSTLWVFRTGGSLDIFRRTVRMADARPLLKQHLERHLYWWTEPMGKAGDRKLCYTARPGRNGSSCVTYELGSRTDSAGHTQRTLALTGIGWNFRSVFTERAGSADGA